MRARKKMANNSQPGIQADVGPPGLPLGEESSSTAHARGGGKARPQCRTCISGKAWDF